MSRANQNPPLSGQPCGCDAGARHLCEQHETLIVVVAAGQRLIVHWQQPDLQPTITEHLIGPGGASTS